MGDWSVGTTSVFSETTGYTPVGRMGTLFLRLFPAMGVAVLFRTGGILVVNSYNNKIRSYTGSVVLESGVQYGVLHSCIRFNRAPVF